MLWSASLLVTTDHRDDEIDPLSNPSQKRKLPGQSVAATAQFPLPVHVMPAPHDTGVPHCPHASHVCTPLPEHCFELGVHTGVEPHEQEPHAQVVLHASLPYVLQACVALGAHTP
jgi:hypothetical protein